MIILGVDPAPKNFGFSIIAYRENKNIDLLEAGYMKNTIQEQPTEKTVNAFCKEFRALAFEADMVVYERFKVRVTRFMKGEASEMVNIMIGLMHACRPEATGVLASSWKRRKDFVQAVPVLYKASLKKHSHLADATCIAVYPLEPHSIMNSIESLSKELYNVRKSLKEVTT